MRLRFFFSLIYDLVYLRFMMLETNPRDKMLSVTSDQRITQTGNFAQEARGSPSGGYENNRLRPA